MSRKNADPAPGSGGRRRFPLALVPVIVSLLLYATTLPGDFVFDDTVLLRDDERVQNFDPRRIFLENYWGKSRATPNYRPLVLVTYALNFLFSDEPIWFHLVNVLLNAAVVFIFYCICRRIFDRLLPALLATGLFALFPVHTEAVAWIVGRAELLAALAILGAWLVVQRAPSGEGTWQPFAAAGLVLVGLFAKENTAAAALLIPAAIFFTRRVLAWRTLLLSGLAILIFLGCWLVALHETFEDIESGRSTPRILIDNPLFFAAAPERILNGIRLVGLYAVKILIPVGLSADYSYNQLPVLPVTSASLWGAVLAVCAVFAGLIAFFWRRAPLVSFGALFFLVAIFPVSNIPIAIGTPFGERLAYTPSAGIAILVAAFLEWSGFLRAVRRGEARVFWLSLLLFPLCFYAPRAVLRNLDWRAAEVLYLRMPLDAPGSARAHLKAAEGHLILARKAPGTPAHAGGVREARREIARAREIYPIYPRAVAFLGEVLLEEGREAEASKRAAILEEAVRTLDEASRLFAEKRLSEPKIRKLKGEALLRLAQLLRGDPDARRRVHEEAERLFTEYLDILRERTGLSSAEVLSQRGIARTELGRTREARQDFDSAIALAPEIPDLYRNRAFFRLLNGDVDGALEDYRAALRVCEKRGDLFLPMGQNALAFRRQIFHLLLKSRGDRAAAARELEAIRAMGPAVPREVIENLEKQLGAPPARPADR